MSPGCSYKSIVAVQLSSFEFWHPNAELYNKAIDTKLISTFLFKYGYILILSCYDVTVTTPLTARKILSGLCCHAETQRQVQKITSCCTTSFVDINRVLTQYRASCLRISVWFPLSFDSIATHHSYPMTLATLFTRFRQVGSSNWSYGESSLLRPILREVMLSNHRSAMTTKNVNYDHFKNDWSPWTGKIGWSLCQLLKERLAPELSKTYTLFFHYFASQNLSVMQMTSYIALSQANFHPGAQHSLLQRSQVLVLRGPMGSNASQIWYLKN